MKKWVLLALMAAYAPACLGAAPGKAANNLFAEREEVGGRKLPFPMQFGWHSRTVTKSLMHKRRRKSMNSNFRSRVPVTIRLCHWTVRIAALLKRARLLWAPKALKSAKIIHTKPG